MTTPLTSEAVHEALAQAPGWALAEDGALLLRLVLPSAAAAIGFIAAVGALAEKHNHHPELSWVYRTVVVRLLTHEAGNAVSDRDTALLAAIQALLAGAPYGVGGVKV